MAVWYSVFAISSSTASGCRSLHAITQKQTKDPRETKARRVRIEVHLHKTEAGGYRITSTDVAFVGQDEKTRKKPFQNKNTNNPVPRRVLLASSSLV